MATINILHPFRPPGVAIALALLLGLSAPMQAMAAVGFGDNWQARPLIDRQTGAPGASPVAVKTTPSPAVLAEQEARLAPYESFIHEVETALSIVPPMGSSRVKRLNAIQQALFGQTMYTGDAGALLTHLQRVFPEQAARAAAMAATQPGLPETGYRNGAPNPAGIASPSIASAPKTKTCKAPKKRASLFSDSFFDDDAFSRDPFFQDSGFSSSSASGFGSSEAMSSSPGASSEIQSRTYNRINAADAIPPSTAPDARSQEPSRLAGLGQGLAGIAMMAGSLAAGYYLNKKSGRAYPNQRWPYGAPYGASPYYSPYNPYGYAPYGLNGTAYGYGAGYPYNGRLSPGISLPYAQLPPGVYQTTPYPYGTTIYPYSMAY